MEKEQIKIWYKRFSTREEDEECIILKEEITDTSATMIYEVTDVYLKHREKIHYSWEHFLYISAVDALEEENWVIHSAFKVDDDYYLIVKDKRSENLFIESSIDKQGKEKNVLLRTSFTKHMGDVSIEVEDEDNPFIDEKAYMKKRNDVEKFLHNWITTKSEDRLLYALGEKKLIIVS